MYQLTYLITNLCADLAIAYNNQWKMRTGYLNQMTKITYYVLLFFFFATYYLRLNYIEIVNAITCNFILYLTSLFVNHNGSNYSITGLHMLSNNTEHFIQFNEEIISKGVFFKLIIWIKSPRAMCQTSKPTKKIYK